MSFLRCLCGALGASECLLVVSWEPAASCLLGACPGCRIKVIQAIEAIRAMEAIETVDAIEAIETIEAIGSIETIVTIKAIGSVKCENKIV